MLNIVSNLSDKNINKAVNDVLNSPRFVNAAKQENMKGNENNFLIRLLRSIGKLFNKLHIKGPNLANATSQRDNWYAYIIEILILFLILGIIIFLIVKFFLKREKIKLGEKNNPEKIDINADYYSMAKEASIKSDLKSAIRFMFLGILVNLSKLKLLNIDEGKTNYQYYLELKKNNLNKFASKNFLITFKNCIFIFNEIWYGKKEANLQKYDICKTFYEEIADILGGKAK
jgi:large-conductance mechanosensitive channel